MKCLCRGLARKKRTRSDHVVNRLAAERIARLTRQTATYSRLSALRNSSANTPVVMEIPRNRAPKKKRTGSFVSISMMQDRCISGSKSSFLSATQLRSMRMSQFTCRARKVLTL